MSLHEEHDRQRERRTCDIEFPIVAAENEPDELDAESHPEKHIKLDETLEDLVVRKHLLDAPIRAQELVHLPTELCVDFVS